jgi:hypothetical protein
LGCGNIFFFGGRFGEGTIFGFVEGFGFGFVERLGSGFFGFWSGLPLAMHIQIVKRQNI